MKRAAFRTDSTLGNLPETRQREIAEFCLAVKDGDRYAETVRWLGKAGVRVSRSALARWFYGWRSRQMVGALKERTQAFEEAMKTECPRLSAQQIRESGQLYFTVLAQESEDSKEFRDMEYLRLAKQIAETKAEFERQKIEIRKEAERRAASRLKFDREKFEFDASKAAIANAKELKTIIADKSLTEQERIDAVRLRLFGPKAMEGPQA